MYNPALSEIWTNPLIGLFSTNSWVKCLTQSSGFESTRWVKTSQSLGLSIFRSMIKAVKSSSRRWIHCFTTIGQDEFNKRITTSKPTTCLLDPVPSKLLKELLPVAEEPLLNIINSLLSLGHIPKPFSWRLLSLLLTNQNYILVNWQITRNKEKLENYRPISNLPFMSKILERVVSAQLCSFLLKNVYEEFYSGFRPCHSTEITKDLLLASDKGCISLLVLLDLSAAFDTIDHDILIDRLQNYTGVQGRL